MAKKKHNRIVIRHEQASPASPKQTDKYWGKMIALDAKRWKDKPRSPHSSRRHRHNISTITVTE